MSIPMPWADLGLPVEATPSPAVTSPAPQAVPVTDEPTYLTPWDTEDYHDAGIQSPQAEKLRSSYVAPLVAAAADFHTIDTWEWDEVTEAGGALPPQRTKQYARLKEATERAPLLVMPWYGVNAVTRFNNGADESLVPTTFQWRPGAAVEGAPKYEFAAKSTVIGIHPATPAEWLDEAPIVTIAEGILKGYALITGWLVGPGGIDPERLASGCSDVASARAFLRSLMVEAASNGAVPEAVIILGGSGNWHQHADWRGVRLAGREVRIALDGDVATNPHVFREGKALVAHATKSKASAVRMLAVTDDLAAEKVGVDDFLAQHGDYDALLRHLDDLPESPPRALSVVEKAREAARTGFTIGGNSGIVDVPDVSVCEEIAADADAFPLTYIGCGSRVFRHFGRQIAWCEDIKGWRVYTGTHWETAGALVKVHEMIFSVMRSISVHEAAYAERSNAAVIEANRKIDAAKASNLPSVQFEEELVRAKKGAREALEKFGQACENTGSALTRVIEFLKTRCSVPKNAWDWHELRINGLNGTFDIMDEVLRPHRPEDRITRILACEIDLDATSEDVEAVLKHAERQCPGTRRILERWSGLCLTRATDARSALVIEGVGSAAKSTWCEAVLAMGGGTEDSAYGVAVDASSIKVRHGNASGHSDALDRLAGRTFVIVDECQGIPLDTELLKKAISGATLSTSAKGMSTRSWSAEMKWTLLSNGPFRFPAADRAWLDRLIPLTFNVPVPPEERDGYLRTRITKRPENLRAVAAVAIKGAVEWYREKCRLEAEKTPNAAVRALGVGDDLAARQAEYGAQANALTAFFDDVAHVEVDDVRGEEALAKKYGNLGRADNPTWLAYYTEWARKHGRRPMSDGEFNSLANALGYVLGNPTEATYRDDKLVRVFHAKKKFRKGIRFAHTADWWRLVDRYVTDGSTAPF